MYTGCPASNKKRLFVLAITQAVNDNNAFLLGKNILTAYANLDIYKRELDSGGVGAVQEAMAAALKRHPDPPMFIVNALITVGTVAVIKELDSDFELAISELLVNVLERYVQWHHEHPDERTDALKLAAASSAGKRASTPAVISGFHLESPTSLMDDLIVLDDQPIFKRPSSTVSSQMQRIGSSPINLLDDDADKPTLLQVAVLKPVIPNLLDLSITSGSNLFSSSDSSTMATTPTVSSYSSPVNSSICTDPNEGTLHTDDSEPEQDDLIVEVDLMQLDKAKQLVLNQRSPQAIHLDRRQADMESDFEELLKVFDDHRRGDKDYGSADRDNAAEKVQDGSQDDTGLIQQRHRDKLLQEILGGKHSLQLYSVIDVLEMHADLLKPVDESTETYGWILARELYKRGRFRESSVVIFEYLESPRSRAPSDSLLSVQKPSSLVTKEPSATFSQVGGGGAGISTKNVGAVTISITAYESSENTKEPLLRSLAASLRASKVVGMDTEWLPQTEEYEKHQPAFQRTAILQLACDVNATVYVVDTIAFLESGDGGLSLVEVIGSTFNNPKICKIAYDWDGDHDLLLATFPALYQEKYRPRNFLDFKHLCFMSSHNAPSSASHQLLSTSPSMPSAIQSDGPGASVSTGAGTGGYTHWSEYQVPNMFTIPGGLSGMLTRLCGRKLDKSQQCSHWEQRPLSPEQLLYAAIDAWCLLDIYKILEKITKISLDPI
ncbi:Exonuclease mut-7 [Mortierella sp. GBA43]|nr:Exonuclease mut-7 [Mortierella sp. GBA43]